MHITMVGTGYVGLVSGAGFADFGLNVTCIDCDEQKVIDLQQGKIPIYEIGLEEIVRRNVRNNRLSFSTDLKSAVRRSLVVFVAVGTPEGPDGDPDLSQVESVARSLAEYVDEYKVIVTKSTVPIGTGRWIRTLIEENQKRKIKFDIVSNPEFLREGSAIEDFMRPNRVVIGADSEHAAAIVKDIHRPLYLIETPFVVTSLETAELIKYASNAFLATKISFINEIANLCEKVGADVQHVARAMGLDKRIGPKFLHAGPGLDKRIGPKFLHAGPGFGGSCFPKDVLALTKMGERHGSRMRILESVLEVNRKQRELVLQKLEEALQGLANKRVGILGLSFKPNTDDVRESPGIALCKRLVEKNVQVLAYDPLSIPNAKKVLNGNGVSYCRDAYEAVTNCDAVLVATEWNEFRNIDLAKIKSLMRNLVILDPRNIFDPEKVEGMGFKYLGTGRARS